MYFEYRSNLDDKEWQGSDFVDGLINEWVQAGRTSQNYLSGRKYEWSFKQKYFLTRTETDPENTILTSSSLENLCHSAAK